MRKKIEHTGPETGRLAFLDYLRIIAFVSVLVGHEFYKSVTDLIQNEQAHATFRMFARLLEPLVFGGGTGVVLFFMVSGYVNTHVLQKEQSVVFFIKRIFRIYPLFAFAVLLQYGLDLHHGVVRDKLELLMQLTLLGDFFGTPGTLGWVDWSLRIEIVFYAFMTLLAAFGIPRREGKFFPCIIVASTVALAELPAFPDNSFTIGYLNIFAPFLFLGAMFYLAEKGRVTGGVLFWFTVLVLSQSCTLVEIHRPNLVGAQFSIYAYLIFLVAWLGRKFLQPSTLFQGLSELTFSIYLFHTWLFESILARIGRFKWTLFGKENDALFILFAFCLVCVFAIERPGIAVGRRVAAFVQERLARRRQPPAAMQPDSRAAI